MNWNGDVNFYPVTDAVERLSVQFAFAVSDREEWFLRYCVRKYFPSHIEEYAVTSPKFVARWIESNGFSTNRHPDGKIEFVRHGKVLETLKALPCF